jgi:hypothetical protein
MIDFYDPTSLSSAIDADLKKRMEISEAFLAELFQPGLVETKDGLRVSKFSKSFRLGYVEEEYLQYLDELYADDFLYIDYLFPVNKLDIIELDIFLCLLGKKGVY